MVAEVEMIVQAQPKDKADLCRKTIALLLSTENRFISLHVKWNSPALLYSGPVSPARDKAYGRDLLVINLRQKDCLLLIFPTGKLVTGHFPIIDRVHEDGRSMIKIHDHADLLAKAGDLHAYIRSWINEVSNS